MEEGVSHKELSAALGAQTALLISEINRSEDNLKEDIKAVKSDISDDIEAIDRRVTHIERRSRIENVIASIVTFFSVLLYNKFGGSG